MPKLKQANNTNNKGDQANGNSSRAKNASGPPRRRGSIETSQLASCYGNTGCNDGGDADNKGDSLPGLLTSSFNATSSNNNNSRQLRKTQNLDYNYGALSAIPSTNSRQDLQLSQSPPSNNNLVERRPPPLKLSRLVSAWWPGVMTPGFTPNNGDDTTPLLKGKNFAPSTSFAPSELSGYIAEESSADENNTALPSATLTPVLPKRQRGVSQVFFSGLRQLTNTSMVTSMRLSPGPWQSHRHHAVQSTVQPFMPDCEVGENGQNEDVGNETTKVKTRMSITCSSYKSRYGRSPSIGINKVPDLGKSPNPNSVTESHNNSLHLSSNGNADDTYNNDEDNNDAEVYTERHTSSWVAGWNVSNLIQGIGILGIPYACVGAGWTVVLAIVLVAMICCHTGLLIGECLYSPRWPQPRETPNGKAAKLKNSPTSNTSAYGCAGVCGTNSPLSCRQTEVPLIRTRETYSCIASVVWPRYGRRIVSSIVVIELFGAIVLYIILLGNSASQLVYLSGSSLKWSKSAFTVLFGYCCLPFLLYPRMRVIAWLSLIAVIGLLGTVTSLLGYCFLQLPTGRLSWSRMPPPSPQQMPIALNIIVFSYCVHAVLPGIEGSMRQPENFPKMLKYSFGLAVLVKIAVGILPAMLFGEATRQAVVDNVAKDGSLNFALFIHAAVCLNVFFSVPLIAHVLSNQIDNLALPKLDSDWCAPNLHGWLPKPAYALWLLSTRAAVISLAVLIALKVPQFALIMGLIGAMTGSLLCFVLPAYFHLRLFAWRLTAYQVALRWIVIVFGLLSGVFGAYFSGMELVNSFNTQE